MLDGLRHRDGDDVKNPMIRRRLPMVALVGLGTLALAAGCIVHETVPDGTAGASISVGSTESYWVNSYPPEPLYEVMTPSPGYGYVWIDGYWHWSGYDWSWNSGRWVASRPGYVYVAPHYDYLDGRYVYRSSYWSQRSRLPRSVRIRSYRDGRPPTYRPRVRDHRRRRVAPTVRDPRAPSPTYRRRPATRDHRNGDRDRDRRPRR
jgi:hypothetical protein